MRTERRTKPSIEFMLRFSLSICNSQCVPRQDLVKFLQKFNHFLWRKAPGASKSFASYNLQLQMLDEYNRL